MMRKMVKLDGDILDEDEIQYINTRLKTNKWYVITEIDKLHKINGIPITPMSMQIYKLEHSKEGETKPSILDGFTITINEQDLHTQIHNWETPNPK